MSRRFVFALAALLAAPMTAAAAPPSGSIVFVRDGDVWRINASGTRQQQITRDGAPARPYRVPSQADDGSVVALRGGQIHRWALNGAALDAPSVASLRGEPVDVDVSPDGGRVAVVLSSPCPAPDGTAMTCRAVAVAGAAGGTAEVVVPAAPDVRSAVWSDRNRLLVTRGNAIEAVSPATGETATWVPDDGTGAALTDITGGGRGIAVIRRVPAGEPTLRVHTPPTATSAPAVWCEFGGPGTAAPSWGPRGDVIAWQVSGGIVVATFPARRCPQQARMLVADGIDPDWGPSALARRMVSGGAASAGGGSTSGSGGATSAATEIAALTAGPGLRLAMRLNVTGRVRMVLDRRVAGRMRVVRTVRTGRRTPGRVLLNLGNLQAGTYRVRVRVEVGDRSIPLPALRLVVRRG